MILAIGVTLIAVAAGQYRPHTFLKGDCPYYAAAAVSIWQDGDLDLRNQVRGGLEVHSSQLALGARGEWYPKHPVLMPAVSLPWLAAGGLDGALVFNLTVVLALFLVLAVAAGRFAAPAAGWLAAILVLFTTPIADYVYNFSPDLFGSLLVTGGVVALFSRCPGWAGALLAAAVWTRLTNGIFLLGGFVYLSSGHDRRGAIRFVLGGLPLFAAMAAVQQQMFGAFWRTGYDRTLLWIDGRSWLITHRGFFDYPFWQGFREQLFLPGKGLLVTAPLLWLVPAGWIELGRRWPRETAYLVATGSALFLLFCKYRFWQMSHYGNRFLFPLICLSVLPLAALLNGMTGRLASPRRAATPAARKEPA